MNKVGERESKKKTKKKKLEGLGFYKLYVGSLLGLLSRCLLVAWPLVVFVLFVCLGGRGVRFTRWVLNPDPSFVLLC